MEHTFIGTSAEEHAARSKPEHICVTAWPLCWIHSHVTPCLCGQGRSGSKEGHFGGERDHLTTLASSFPVSMSVTEYYKAIHWHWLCDLVSHRFLGRLCPVPLLEHPGPTVCSLIISQLNLFCTILWIMWWKYPEIYCSPFARRYSRAQTTSTEWSHFSLGVTLCSLLENGPLVFLWWAFPLNDRGRTWAFLHSYFLAYILSCAFLITFLYGKLIKMHAFIDPGSD